MTRFFGIYQFNQAGLELFREVMLGDADEQCLDPVDRSLASLVKGTKEFVPVKYRTAGDMARAIIESFNGLVVEEQLSNIGLWAWLAYALRDQLYPQLGDGRRRLGEVHRWDPSDPNHWHKGQRHLVRMPVHLLSSLGKSADHLLCRAPSVLSEIREQLTSQQDMFTTRFQEVARTLYYDPEKKDLKHGAGGSGGGSPRRLAKVRQQLDVAWELDDLSTDQILALLPKEFDAFRI